MAGAPPVVGAANGVTISRGEKRSLPSYAGRSSMRRHRKSLMCSATRSSSGKEPRGANRGVRIE